MTKNDKLYQAALDAVKELFSDNSVTADEARDNLRTLRDEIDIMIDSLE